jgi:electron transfer flavoprotein alpha subunit
MSSCSPPIRPASPRRPRRSPASRVHGGQRTRPTRALIAQVQAPQVAGSPTGYTHVFGPSTTFGKDLMPCIAALLDVAQVAT